MSDRIQPRTVKGFRDSLPEIAMARQSIIDTATAVYRSYGFVPIDTPALEYSEILLGKGGDESDKQMFRFEDHGGRDVGLRFDLTVPLARFVAQHAGELGMPFKRYHVGTVWRGEKPQRGRYREFVQCDFDTIGSTAVAADAETILVVVDVMRALGLDDAVVRFNHRGVLSGLLERLELGDRTAGVLRILDKLSKIGPERVADELRTTVDATDAQVGEILDLTAVEGASHDVLLALEPLVGQTEAGAAALERLTAVVAAVEAAGVPERAFAVDVSIARGLDYYTGLVYETYLGSLPSIGSISSGGRYDDLAGVYTTQSLPGIGGSLGVDRLLAALEHLDRLEMRRTAADVLLTLFDPGRLDDHLAVAAGLRAAGVAVEVYADERKLSAQLRYADRRGHGHVVIIGDDEWAAGTAQVKDMRSGESVEIPLGDIAAHLVAGAGEPAG